MCECSICVVISDRGVSQLSELIKELSSCEVIIIDINVVVMMMMTTEGDGLTRDYSRFLHQIPPSSISVPVHNNS
jgi:hypothetical protein